MMHSSGHKADGDGIVTDTPETDMHISYMGQSTYCLRIKRDTSTDPNHRVCTVYNHMVITAF
jgi:hypothetical protein